MQEKLKKKSGAFRTIRFWETKFSQIKPMKRGGNRRYYRPEDIAVLERIHELLYDKKYTIKGAQGVLKGNTRNQIAEVSNNNKPEIKVVEKGLSSKQVAMLKDTLSNLKNMRKVLAKAG
jgi:DNA-binding transcriptional MerR regulator